MYNTQSKSHTRRNESTTSLPYYNSNNGKYNLKQLATTNAAAFNSDTELIKKRLKMRYENIEKRKECYNNIMDQYNQIKTYQKQYDEYLKHMKSYEETFLNNINAYTKEQKEEYYKYKEQYKQQYEYYNNYCYELEEKMKKIKEYQKIERREAFIEENFIAKAEGREYKELSEYDFIDENGMIQCEHDMYQYNAQMKEILSEMMKKLRKLNRLTQSQVNLYFKNEKKAE
ncbi:hypothetical protein BCR32DRAFT_128635 [Anaeromyces robustus]|uniref:Uncharacterized protein n=1 Tax=Anaeromyces robustus TaxID=1754192 RepID=A0A1Y1VT53_9FUNG|nr:hypothetical protein BCR32DRAFT_128635 [Anaeromyces robustus]|eukprot:ORX64467.1 hypothetical protein BCR32DRAFT_128635 [Anaeromyces robustus]